MKFVFGACGLALFLCVADSQAFATGKKVGLDGFPVTSYPPNDLDTVRPDNTVHFPAPDNRKKDLTEITDTQPSGSLTGRIVYLNGGHGMAYSSGSNWPLGRSVGNNMTEDLGNISSMWRDHNGAFLDYLVARRELRCGSGTLCDHRGGACPACVMVPETSCIAGNQLLSRAALAGGRAPLWDMNTTPLRGYYQIVRDLRAQAAGGP